MKNKKSVSMVCLLLQLLSVIIPMIMLQILISDKWQVFTTDYSYEIPHGGRQDNYPIDNLTFVSKH